jgi:DNA sulfur modification protein DndC
MKQPSLFEDGRLTLAESIELTTQSLEAYATQYRHWSIAYSGGKDSTATVTIIKHLIDSGRISSPESLTVLYADTRQELPPLHIGAMRMLSDLSQRGVNTKVVLPEMDDRYFVYMFGRGVPPPNNNTLRWCTPQIKVEPMVNALKALHEESGEKILMITGVRIGESAVRDQRIALSCGRNGAECGQGWFQETTPASVADTLAPLLHWRVCHVWDWLMLFAPAHGFPTSMVAEVYGGEEAEEINARTGCIGCPLATKDTALDYILKMEQWSYLKPLKRLRILYEELRGFKFRLQKDGERLKDGRLSSNPNRKGPLTMDARRYGLSIVLDVQNKINTEAERLGCERIDLINEEEQDRILELIAKNQWPNGWTGTEPRGDVLIPQTLGEDIIQPILFV